MQIQKPAGLTDREQAIIMAISGFLIARRLDR